jgi:hypothetical protein
VPQVEHLLSKPIALSANPSTAKNKKYSHPKLADFHTDKVRTPNATLMQSCFLGAWSPALALSVLTMSVLQYAQQIASLQSVQSSIHCLPARLCRAL